MSSKLLKYILLFLEVIKVILPVLIDFIKTAGVNIYEKAKRFTKR